MLAALGIGPLVACFRVGFGLPGAATAVLLLGLGLVLAGYGSLRREGRQPAWHHHLARPMAASLVMAPVCLLLQRWHVMLACSGRGPDLRRGALEPGRIASDEALEVCLPSARADSAAVR